MAYVRKTCACCKGQAHESVMEDAECTYSHYIRKGFTVQQALGCVTLAFGKIISARIENSVPSK